MAIGWSIRFQFPNFPTPSDRDCKRVLEELEPYSGIRPGEWTARQEPYDEDIMRALAMKWMRDHGRDVKLGIVTERDGEEDFAQVMTYDNRISQRVLWVHHKSGHWSGLRPPGDNTPGEKELVKANVERIRRERELLGCPEPPAPTSTRKKPKRPGPITRPPRPPYRPTAPSTQPTSTSTSASTSTSSKKVHFSEPKKQKDRCQYLNDFPSGRKVVYTSGTANECGLNALASSIQNQLPDVPVPDLKQLKGILRKMEKESHKLKHPWTKENYVLQEDQLGEIARRWLQSHGSGDMKLGITGAPDEDTGMADVRIPWRQGEATTDKVLWIHYGKNSKRWFGLEHDQKTPENVRRVQELMRLMECPSEGQPDQNQGSTTSPRTKPTSLRPILKPTPTPSSPVTTEPSTSTDSRGANPPNTEATESTGGTTATEPPTTIEPSTTSTHSRKADPPNTKDPGSTDGTTVTVSLPTTKPSMSSKSTHSHGASPSSTKDTGPKGTTTTTRAPATTSETTSITTSQTTNPTSTKTTSSVTSSTTTLPSPTSTPKPPDEEEERRKKEEEERQRKEEEERWKKDKEQQRPKLTAGQTIAGKVPSDVLYGNTNTKCLFEAGETKFQVFAKVEKREYTSTSLLYLPTSAPFSPEKNLN